MNDFCRIGEYSESYVFGFDALSSTDSENAGRGRTTISGGNFSTTTRRASTTTTLPAKRQFGIGPTTVT